MTSFSGIYSSLTGLYSFSAALNTISNDVANLNTIGFKQSDSLFEDIGPLNSNLADSNPRQDEGSLGQGVTIGAVVQEFSQGDIQTTGNATDLAINGNGFFILHEKGQNVYTRDGQFRFDDKGNLTDSVSGAPVQALAADGSLQNLVVNRFQTIAAVPTTAANFAGTLSTGSPSASVTNVAVIDASGAARTLNLAFTNNTATTTGQWGVVVTDDKGNQLITGDILFSGDGTPKAGSNTLTVNLKSADGSSSPITLNFGAAGSSEGVNSLSSGSMSSIAFTTADGSALGTLSGITIDANGVVQLAFTNGKTDAGPQLAIASFANPDELTEIGSANFVVPKNSSLTPTIGKPGQGGLGPIEADSVELANVDLSQEFSKIIILQRGYQGGSQILNVSSKLIEDLYNSLGGHS